MDSNNAAPAGQKWQEDEDRAGLIPTAKILTNRCWFTRYTISLLVAVGYTVSSMQRACFNIALVAMVNFTSEDTVTNRTHDVCPDIQRTYNHTLHYPKEGEFNWNEKTQSLLLGGFYYGYIILQIPGGYIADRFGAKRIMAFSIVLPSVVCLLVPIVARWSVDALFVLRVFAGLATGPLMPSVYSLLGKWMPITERAKSLALLTSVSAMGSVVSPFLTGFLCDSPDLGGWPTTFYVFGVPGFVWLAFWLFLVYDSPKKHPTLKKDELDYLSSITEEDSKIPTPFKSILTSVPVWSTIVTFFCDDIGYYVIFSTFPLYLREILKCDAANIGIINAIMSCGNGVMVFVAGALADYSIKKHIFSVTWNRKIATIISEIVLITALVIIALGACNRDVAVVAIIIGYSFAGINAVGFQLSPMDMAPEFAGMIMGLCNSAGNIAGFVAPLIVGSITKDQADFRSWQAVFYMTSAVLFVSMLNFTLLSSSERQKWAMSELVEGHITPDQPEEGCFTPDQPAINEALAAQNDQPS